MDCFDARWLVYMKAVIFRGLMGIGMKFHHIASPSPPRPAFTIKIPSRLSSKPGSFQLVFYVPEDYLSAPDDLRYPVVINYHGGGFTLGTGTDDARWARAVIENAHAVFVSVEYRLAPEYPFSVGVEDGTDAVIYLAAHADELKLDPHQIALSGFSAGGNFAFTVPIMLHELQNDVGKRTLRPDNDRLKRPESGSSSRPPSLLGLDPAPDEHHDLPLKPLEPTVLEEEQIVPDLTIKAIVSFYPPTDFRQTREEKRITNINQSKNLPPLLTNLFDKSYMHPAETISFSDPYLSPAAAPDHLLKAAYPKRIVLYTCEYDMLNAEGVAFGERLRSPAVGKDVKGGLIREVPHAFDKKPNPIHFPKAADRCYNEATAELASIFGYRASHEERRQLDLSKQVDRFEDDEHRAGVTNEGESLIHKGKMKEGSTNQLKNSSITGEENIRP